MDNTLITEMDQWLIAMIIDIREKSGMIQTELTDALGEYQSFVARLKSGQRKLDIIEFIHMAEFREFAI